MPYINKLQRETLDEFPFNPASAGELNYVITSIINNYLNGDEGTNYTKINEIVGALECAKQEFYRRIASPYEDKKIEENGDVY